MGLNGQKFPRLIVYVIPIIAMIGISLFLYFESFDILNTQETQVTRDTVILESTETKIQSTTSKVKKTTVQAEFISKNKLPPPISTLSAQNYPFLQKAFAVTPDQLTIDFLQYQFNTLDRARDFGFDSDHNFFLVGGTQVSMIDISLNEQTTWIIPNDGIVHNRGIGTNSQGNVYFVVDSGIVTKLDVTNNQFTLWDIGTGVIQIIVDSNDKLILRNNVNIMKLDPDTGLLTTWNTSPGPGDDFFLDESNNDVYYTASSRVLQLDLDDNSLTQWNLLNNFEAEAITVDSNSKVWFT